ncbi:hypothetical protein C2845_PM03G02140 [Panicum miliaceum]|uniref:Uncharacterized protein n=1 Tax=Panicum miliaceum TaxID=4540 RepID=A0A3L6T6Y4_PANMI|nr:hypothetical protein C2845_PM03G02140 [Panicum miliaceum]
MASYTHCAALAHLGATLHCTGPTTPRPRAAVPDVRGQDAGRRLQARQPAGLRRQHVQPHRPCTARSAGTPTPIVYKATDLAADESGGKLQRTRGWRW